MNVIISSYFTLNKWTVISSCFSSGNWALSRKLIIDYLAYYIEHFNYFSDALLRQVWAKVESKLQLWLLPWLCEWDYSWNKPKLCRYDEHSFMRVKIKPELHAWLTSFELPLLHHCKTIASIMNPFKFQTSATLNAIFLAMHLLFNVKA